MCCIEPVETLVFLQRKERKKTEVDEFAIVFANNPTTITTTKTKRILKKGKKNQAKRTRQKSLVVVKEKDIV